MRSGLLACGSREVIRMGIVYHIPFVSNATMRWFVASNVAEMVVSRQAMQVLSFEGVFFMDESRVAFLRRMIASPSPSGFEQPVQQVIREEIQHYTDEVRTDVHGNVIAALNPAGQPRVMLTAHCDELGFLIRYIDAQGFLYFAPI